MYLNDKEMNGNGGVLRGGVAVGGHGAGTGGACHLGVPKKRKMIFKIGVAFRGKIV